MAGTKVAEAAAAASAEDMEVDFDMGAHITTEHNSRLYKATQHIKELIDDLTAYHLANPRIANPTSRADIDREKEVEREIEIKKKWIRASLTTMRTLWKESAWKLRDEKDLTAKSRTDNDTLILMHKNLQYEEISLQSQISAAENYDHKYKKLQLIPVDEFLEMFPEHKDAPEGELMTARIEHEHQVRVKLEERRQEKLKQKQMLIAEVKKRKDDLTNLDGMLEKFTEAAEPIRKTLEDAAAE